MNIVQEKNEPRSKLLRREPRERMREALVAAAEATIERHGLAALRARDLAEATGCAVGTIYNLFSDLDGLIVEVNIRTLARLDGELARAAGAPDAEARLVALALAYLDFAAAHPARWAALFEHRLAEGAVLPESYADALAHLFLYVEEPLGALAGRGDGEAARRLSRSVFSAIHGVVALGLSEKLATIPPATLRGEVEAIARALARGLSSTAVGTNPAPPARTSRPG